MIRKFRLYNNANDMIDLLANLDFFGINPSGLGVSFDNQLYGANANFLSGGLGLNQGQLSLDILFGAESGESYRRYFEFVKFLDKTPYRLYYETDAGGYWRDCVLNELTKSELNEWSILQESFVLDFKTPFYRWESEEAKEVEDNLADGKIYNYIYDYIYESEYSGRKGVFKINNESVYLGSSIGSPVEITIEGPCENPYWEVLTDLIVDQSDGFNLVVQDGYKLVVSSVPNEQRAELIAPDGTISNVYQQQDLARSNFVTLPQSKSTLIFHNAQKISIKYREEFVAV